MTPRRILVVDDSETNVDMLARRLQRSGYHVLTASNGPAALEIVGREPLDLVILDVMMPGMSGIDVLETIRRHRSSTALPVIMATAKSDARDTVEALDKGANDYVTKPIEFSVLLARIRVLLRAPATPAPVPAPDPTTARVGPGAVLEDKYRLEDVIGVGGFGTVYRAIQLALERPVAIKLLHPYLLESPEAVQRFEQEGISACRVRHPNAVAMLDAGTTAHGLPYLVMELLEGLPLSAELAQRGPIRFSRAAAITGAVCDALEEAHRAGIIHRDIKPANVMLGRGPGGEETVKVLDFGIAKLVESQSMAVHTLAELVGTPHYMAPERLLGRPYDSRSDIYSVGVTLYEMLTVRPPFPRVPGGVLQHALQQLQGAPTPLEELRPDLPAELARVVMAALAGEAPERPPLHEIRDVMLEGSSRWTEPEWPPPGLALYAERTADASEGDEDHATRPGGTPPDTSSTLQSAESGQVPARGSPSPASLDEAEGAAIKRR